MARRRKRKKRNVPPTEGYQAAAVTEGHEAQHRQGCGPAGDNTGKNVPEYDMPTEREIPTEILARGPAAREAYLQEAQAGTKRVYRARLMLIGQERVDKTIILKTFSGKSFDGKDVSSLCEVQGNSIQPWKQQKRGAADIPDDIFEEIEQPLPKKQKGGGAKSAQHADQDENLPEFNIWDLKDKDVFYNIHQVFFTHRDIYVLLFDLDLDLNENNKDHPYYYENKLKARCDDFTELEFLDLLMQSISAHASTNHRDQDRSRQVQSPPIFIVGTNMESASSYPNRIRPQIDKKFETIEKMILSKPYVAHVVNKHYTLGSISNDQTDSQLSLLRRDITSTVRNQPYMGEQIPLKWLSFERFVAETIKKRPFMQVKDLADDLGFTTDEGFFTMLQFYHDLRTIIYLRGDKEENTRNTRLQDLQDIVILDMQWFINIIKQVNTVIPNKEQWPVLKENWYTLKTLGILKDSLLDQMWKDVDDIVKPNLVTIMEMFDLLYPRVPAAKWSDGQTYYVPAFLRHYQELDGAWNSFRTGETCSFYVVFKRFFYDGLFNRLLVHIAHLSQRKSAGDPQLYYRHGIFCLDKKHNFHLEMKVEKTAYVKVTVTKACTIRHRRGFYSTHEESTVEPNSKEFSMVETFLHQALEKLTRPSWIRDIDYEFSVACPCSDKTQSLHFLSLEEWGKEPSIRCKETMIVVDTRVFTPDRSKVEKKAGMSFSTLELLQLAAEVSKDWEDIEACLQISHISCLHDDHSEIKMKVFCKLDQYQNDLPETADARKLLGTALVKCNLIDSAGNCYPKQVTASEKDFLTVTSRLGPSELQLLYLALSLEFHEIEKAEMKMQCSDVGVRGLSVLVFWRKINGSLATREKILNALQECKCNIERRKIEETWKSEYVEILKSNINESDS